MSFADLAKNRTTSGKLSIQSTKTTIVTVENGIHNTNEINNNSSLIINQNKAFVLVMIKLEQFERQVSLIKKLSISNDSMNKDLFTNIEERIQYIVLLQQEVAEALKKIPNEPIINAISKRKICKDFDMISKSFENSIHLITKKQNINNNNNNSSSNISDEIDTNDINKENIEFQELEMIENDIDHNEIIIKEREKDIQKIHESVAQVNEIFKDLARIVDEQQETIYKIEENIEQSNLKTKEGLEQVKKAAEMQRTCCLQ